MEANVNVNDIVNPALILAISRMRENNTSETRNKMLLEALNARFLVPFSMKMKPGTEKDPKRTQENTTINFNMLKNDKNEMYFIAFTDAGELEKWKATNQGTLLMLMRFDDLAHLVHQNEKDIYGFILNPNSTNVGFRRDVIDSVLKMRDQAIAEGKMVVKTVADAKEGQQEEEGTKEEA